MRRSVATDSSRAGVAGQCGNHFGFAGIGEQRRTAIPTDARARPRRAHTAWRACARSRRGRRRSAPGCTCRIGRATSKSSRARRVATPCGRFALAATASASAWRTVLLEVLDQQLEHRFGERARVALDQVVVLAAELGGQARRARPATDRPAALARRRAKGPCGAGCPGAALDQLGAAPAGRGAWRVMRQTGSWLACALMRSLSSGQCAPARRAAASATFEHCARGAVKVLLKVEAGLEGVAMSETIGACDLLRGVGRALDRRRPGGRSPSCRSATAAAPIWSRSIAAGAITLVEVKSCRADFVADRKWQEYLAYCDRFYFAVGPDFPLRSAAARRGSDPGRPLRRPRSCARRGCGRSARRAARRC